MEQAKKHTGRRILFLTLAILLAAALVAAPFILEKRSRQSEIEASILSDTAQYGTISKTLSGTGTLTEEASVTVTVPYGVEITEYLVSNGEFVSQGQALAAVDKTSVMRAISGVNETLDTLSSEISDAAGTPASQYISAKAAGRIKAVYAAVGDSVRDVITRYGALAVLSLDGKMAADIDAGGLSVGQSVSVSLADGTLVQGQVRSILDGTAVVTIDDLYGSVGENVSIRDAEGNVLGNAPLYVHSPWNVIAYTGTVARIYLAEEKKAWAGANLFRLTDTEDTAEYDLLTAQRQVYEEIAHELFLLYQDGVVKAPCDGCVSGADESLLKQLSVANSGYAVVLLSSNTPPDGTDTTEYHNRVGVITQVDDDGTATAGIQLFDTQIDDYADLSGLSLDTSLMTAEVSFMPGIIYQRSGTDEDGNATWSQLSGVSRGDLYVFAFDADLAWMIYVGHVDLPEPTPEPTPAPTPTPTPKPKQGGSSGGRTGAPSSGGIGGGGGAASASQDEEEPSLYSTVGTTILSLTPQDTISVTITVDELDILSVHAGQDVMVTIDALPGQSFSGDITAIDTTAANDGGNTKYAVEITLSRTEKMLGGMNASAKITLLTKENVLTIPTEALSEGETETVVYTGYDPSTKTLLSPVNVETGLSDGLRTEILSGLSAGDTIWYSYYDTLALSGMPEGFPG